MDTLLSLDPGPDDILYRIRRASGTANRVLYVTVTNLAIIPEEDQTYGPAVIRELRKLKEWSGDWTTLTVNMDGDRISCETDAFPPHSVPKKQLREGYPVFDFLQLHEAYYLLAKSRLAPKLIGYVCEESPDRVVGFLIEPIQGRAASVSDLEACKTALSELHRILLHGDLCKYNVIITSQGPKFIDFEASTPAADAEESSLKEEMEGLEGKLADESGVGRPWRME